MGDLFNEDTDANIIMTPAIGTMILIVEAIKRDGLEHTLQTIREITSELKFPDEGTKEAYEALVKITRVYNDSLKS